ncbi:hypothetical protein GOBAR_AA37008 [Gossypium barbadense]|uniref:tRNA (adenine(58)-N(1))-methyltransferase n=3 Tax=Gossypium TaxID=3633 RepID=A0A2P5VXX9_GOSBA|nr:hypothetical protein GOBAR_AA37008 [Gossypium barbadense]
MAERAQQMDLNLDVVEVNSSNLRQLIRGNLLNKSRGKSSPSFTDCTFFGVSLSDHAKADFSSSALRCKNVFRLNEGKKIRTWNMSCTILSESGTGSGSLTTSFARAVAPTGHVHTFDFHEQRAASAREDFERTGISTLVTVGVRDIQGE